MMTIRKNREKPASVRQLSADIPSSLYSDWLPFLYSRAGPVAVSARCTRIGCRFSIPWLGRSASQLSVYVCTRIRRLFSILWPGRWAPHWEHAGLTSITAQFDLFSVPTGRQLPFLMPARGGRCFHWRRSPVPRETPAGRAETRGQTAGAVSPCRKQRILRRQFVERVGVTCFCG